VKLDASLIPSHHRERHFFRLFIMAHCTRFAGFRGENGSTLRSEKLSLYERNFFIFSLFTEKKRKEKNFGPSRDTIQTKFFFFVVGGAMRGLMRSFFAFYAQLRPER
jgi:hypothetical protein